MANTLTYKGLIARIDFSAEDGALVGRVAGINDAVTVVASLSCARSFSATSSTIASRPAITTEGCTW